MDDDKATLKELLAAEKDVKVEVELFLHLFIEVLGKGKDYSAKVEVQSSDPIEILRSKVSFFRQMQ